VSLVSFLSDCLINFSKKKEQGFQRERTDRQSRKGVNANMPSCHFLFFFLFVRLGQRIKPGLMFF
jgi:hypothetical protein